VLHVNLLEIYTRIRLFDTCIGDVLKAVAKLVLLMRSELRPDAHHVGELDPGTERVPRRDARMGKNPYTKARLDERTDRARALDEPHDRRHAEFTDIVVIVAFVRMPPRGVRLADQREMPVAA